MNEKIIGQNIREIRERQGLTLAVVARRASLTSGALSKIEQGQTSSPISTLISVADALGVPFESLVLSQTKQPNYVVTRKGEGEAVVRDGGKFGYAYEALATEMPGKRVQPFIFTTKPGDKEGTFQHGGQEFMYVLCGKLEMRVGLEKIILSEGDSLYFNPRIEHGSRVIGKTPVKTLSILIQDDPRAAQPVTGSSEKRKS